MLPVVLLALVAACAGALAWLGMRDLLRRWSDRRAAAAVAGELQRHTGVRRWVHGRLDAEALTGLTLTLALLALILAGTLISLLALLVRGRSDLLIDLDAGTARWAHAHISAAGHHVLEWISFLASTPGVLLLGAVIGGIEYLRVRSRWIPVFLVVVALGDSAVTNGVKHLVDRARPTIDPAAATLGPSFPSGHSSTAAAFFAALALLAWRLRPPRVRAVLAGVAVGSAVAVACSRVLLDLHWVSDVVAGLALGWAWFGICAIAFGGALMRFGAPVERAARPQPGQREPDSVRS
jgi:membrane-associated phospholipid phosphatase